MPTITGVCRHQISFLSLDSQITNDNEIRFIDAFVDKLDLKQFPFTIKAHLRKYKQQPFEKQTNNTEKLPPKTTTFLGKG